MKLSKVDHFAVYIIISILNFEGYAILLTYVFSPFTLALLEIFRVIMIILCFCGSYIYYYLATK
jgi:hypothetical protein